MANRTTACTHQELEAESIRLGLDGLGFAALQPIDDLLTASEWWESCHQRALQRRDESLASTYLERWRDVMQSTCALIDLDENDDSSHACDFLLAYVRYRAAAFVTDGDRGSHIPFNLLTIEGGDDVEGSPNIQLGTETVEISDKELEDLLPCVLGDNIETIVKGLRGDRALVKQSMGAAIIRASFPNG